MERKHERCWAEVDLGAIRKNIRRLKSNIKTGTKICAVIKANGYGHGAAKIADNICDLADFFATATIDEALELRASGIRLPILILGYTDASRIEDAINNDIRLTVYDMDTVRRISEIALKLQKDAMVHIKVDTGMSRIGVPCTSDGVDTAEAAAGLSGIDTEGIYTHFYNADADDISSAYEQLERFKNFCDQLDKRGVDIKIRHCSNSAAATRMKEANMDMVRLGISIYGLYPSSEVKDITLEPALSLKSHVTMVKTIEEGTAVSYGARFTASRPAKIATISAGYADGYNRRLSCRADVLINGYRVPIAGSVCMDQIMADVTDVPDVRQGDEVVLVGKQGGEEITLEELADIAGTINYELACLITERVPRYYSDIDE